MQDLTVTLIQTELFWEDIPANLAMFDSKIDTLQNGLTFNTHVEIVYFKRRSHLQNTS